MVQWLSLEKLLGNLSKRLTEKDKRILLGAAAKAYGHRGETGLKN